MELFIKRVTNYSDPYRRTTEVFHNDDDLEISGYGCYNILSNSILNQCGGNALHCYNFIKSFSATTGPLKETSWNLL